jgi:hypothetical protein
MAGGLENSGKRREVVNGLMVDGRLDILDSLLGESRINSKGGWI